MAEIDDSLPNVTTEDMDIELKETEVGVPGTEEVITTDETEVVMNEEGGAEVSFDPTAEPAESQGHFSNLAEVMKLEILFMTITQSIKNQELIGQTLIEKV
jgi:hypothetical protein